MNPTEEALLRKAIGLASASRQGGEAPFGSLLADANGTVLAEDHNTSLADNDITAHPELKLARWAARNLDTAAAAATTMYTSCQPCGMCMGAIERSGLGRVVYALSTEQLAPFKSPPTPGPQLDGPHLHAEASTVVAGYYVPLT